MTTIAWPAPATEDAATTLLEAWRWGTTPICPHCRSERTVRTNGNPMPHRCRDCRRHFAVKTGTVMHNSKLPLTAWVIGALCVQRGMSSVQLAQELGIGATRRHGRWRGGSRRRRPTKAGSLPTTPTLSCPTFGRRLRGLVTTSFGATGCDSS